MTRYHVAVGSNVDPEQNVPAGLRRLHDRFPIQASSRFFITAAIDRPEQPDYWNGIVAIETDLDEKALRQALRDVEAATGRVRGPDKWAARELDLDILLVDGAPADPGELRERPWLAHGLHDLDPAWPRPDWNAREAPSPWPL